MHFTGKQRDFETGNDNLGARYLRSSTGRFMSPDPDGIGSRRTDPQSWNMYPYARNNPLLYTDPNGDTYQICTVDQDGLQQCVTVSDDQFYKAQQTNGQGGNYLKNGGVYYTDQNGHQVQIGTYVQTDVDLRPFAVGALGGSYQRSARALHYMNDAFDFMMVGLLGMGIADTVVPGAVGGLGPGGEQPGRGAELESTGRNVPADLKEQLAMQQAKSSPSAGKQIPITMNDPRWPADQGWIKMSQKVNGVEVHYNLNTQTGETADWKFK
jgi:RHS repeat-associated protein